MRWFELRAAAVFEAADFFPLFERSQAMLGSDLLASEQLTLMPNETRMASRIAHPDARYLGVIAAFRDLEHSVWRVMVPIAPPEALPPGAGGGPREQFVALVCERNSIRTESA
jgi:type VI secretion system protein VasD